MKTLEKRCAEIVLNEMKTHCQNITHVSKNLTVTRQTIYNYVRKFPKMKWCGSLRRVAKKIREGENEHTISKK